MLVIIVMYSGGTVTRTTNIKHIVISLLLISYYL